MAGKIKGIFVAVELDQAALKASVLGAVKAINDGLSSIGSNARIDENKFTRPMMNALNAAERLKASIEGFSNLKDVNKAIDQQAAAMSAAFNKAFDDAGKARMGISANHDLLKTRFREVARNAQMDEAVKSFQALSKSIGATGMEALVLAKQMNVPAEVAKQIESKVVKSLGSVERAFMTMQNAIAGSDPYGMIGRTASKFTNNMTATEKNRLHYEALIGTIRRLSDEMADVAGEKAKAQALREVGEAGLMSTEKLMRMAKVAKLSPENMAAAFGGGGSGAVITAQSLGLGKSNEAAIEREVAKTLDPIERVLLSLRKSIIRKSGIFEPLQKELESLANSGLSRAEKLRGGLEAFGRTLESVKAKMEAFNTGREYASAIRQMYEAGVVTEKQMVKLGNAARLSADNMASLFSGKGSQQFWVAKAAGVAGEALKKIEQQARQSMSGVERLLFDNRAALEKAFAGTSAKDSLDRIAAAMRKVASEKTSVDTLRQLYQAGAITAAEMAKLATNMNLGAKAIHALSAEASLAGTGVGKLFSQLKNLATGGNFMAAIQSAIAVLGMNISVAGIVEFGKAAARTAMQVDSLKTAYTAVFDSSAKASGELEYVRAVSDKLGMEFYNAAAAAKTFYASMQSSDVLRDKADAIFASFASAASALKLTKDETKRMYLAISQMASKGKISAEELRQQLGEVLPGAVTMLSKAMGKTPAELDKMLQAGAVGLENLEKLADAVRSKYGASAVAMSNSLVGQLNKLETAWNDLKAGFWDTQNLTSIFSSLSKAVSVVKDNIGGVTLALKNIGVGVGAAALTAGFVKLTAAVKSIRASMSLFLLDIRTLPSLAALGGGALAAMAVGIGAVTAGLAYMGSKVSESFNQNKDATIAFGDALDAVKGTSNEFISNLAATTDRAKDKLGELSEVANDMALKSSEKALNSNLANLKQFSLAAQKEIEQLRSYAVGYDMALGYSFGSSGEQADAIAEANEKAHALSKTYEGIQVLVDEVRAGIMDEAEAQSRAKDLVEEMKTPLGENSDLFRAISAEVLNTASNLSSVLSLLQAATSQALLFKGALSDMGAPNLDKLRVKELELDIEKRYGGSKGADAKAIKGMFGDMRTVMGGSKSVSAYQAETLAAFAEGLRNNKGDVSKSVDALLSSKKFQIYKTEDGDAIGPASARFDENSTGADKYGDFVRLKNLQDMGGRIYNISQSEGAVATIDDANKKSKSGAKAAAQATYQYENYKDNLQKINDEIALYRKMSEMGQDSFAYELEKVNVKAVEAQAQLDKLVNSLQKQGRSEAEINAVVNAQKELNDLKANESRRALVRKYYDEAEQLGGAYQEFLGQANSYEVRKTEEKYDRMLQALDEMFQRALISEEEYNERRKNLEGAKGLAKNKNEKGVFAGMKQGWEDFAESANDVTSKWKDVTITALDGVSDAFTNFFLSGLRGTEDLGKAFEDLASQVCAMIMKMYVQMLVTNFVGGLFGMGGGANYGTGATQSFGYLPSKELAMGGAYSGASAGFAPGLSAYSGGVYSTPHRFSSSSTMKFASGGVFGEAGPEAIMPLSRMSNGKLGVAADLGGGGGDYAPVFNIEVVNQTGQNSNAEVASSQPNGSGGMDVRLLIKSVVAGDIAGGNGGVIAQSIQGAYGLKRQVRGV